MTHLDEEVLAQWALDGTEPEPDAADHLATCARCQEALAELRELSVELGETPELATPPTQVWDRISADLELAPATTTAAEPEPGTEPQPGPGRGPGIGPGRGPEIGRANGPEAAGGSEPAATRRRTYGRGVLALAASVAAVLGIGIGLGAAGLLAVDEQPAPVAAVRLEPLPGKSGSGTADLIQAGNELQVSVTGLSAETGYYELWLINSDGQRMVSLGVLDPGQADTFRIPDNLTSQGYLIVDVSLEPNDGNPVHSRDSIVRGTLPG
ncbi:anti-sigma factor domain-containing protein [Kribbella sp. NPDC049174]|uniref:anti-sigma factor domain-containing protein n=1 Tax=Kribbella sp. NPDC049174 TaxID=3364112 RepID=UPI0037203385